MVYTAFQRFGGLPRYSGVSRPVSDSLRTTGEKASSISKVFQEIFGGPIENSTAPGRGTVGRDGIGWNGAADFRSGA
jgi:hypothetical protein